MTDAVKLTDHAVLRAREHLGLSAAECGSVLDALWNQGRIPVPADWQAFETIPVAGYAYRVTAFRGRRVLIVRDARRLAFVTLRIIRNHPAHQSRRKQ